MASGKFRGKNLAPAAFQSSFCTVFLALDLFLLPAHAEFFVNKSIIKLRSPIAQVLPLLGMISVLRHKVFEGQYESPVPSRLSVAP